MDHHLLFENALDLEQVVMKNKFSECCKVATKQYITYSSSRKHVTNRSITMAKQSNAVVANVSHSTLTQTSSERHTGNANSNLTIAFHLGKDVSDKHSE